jgi:hypothetical protein
MSSHVGTVHFQLNSICSEYVFTFGFFRFTGNVKLKGVVVIGGEMDSHPSSMKL